MRLPQFSTAKEARLTAWACQAILCFCAGPAGADSAGHLRDGAQQERCCPAAGRALCAAQPRGGLASPLPVAGCSHPESELIQKYMLHAQCAPSSSALSSLKIWCLHHKSEPCTLFGVLSAYDGRYDGALCAGHWGELDVGDSQLCRRQPAHNARQLAGVPRSLRDTKLWHSAEECTASECQRCYNIRLARQATSRSWLAEARAG